MHTVYMPYIHALNPKVPHCALQFADGSLTFSAKGQATSPVPADPDTWAAEADTALAMASALVRPPAGEVRLMDINRLLALAQPCAAEQRQLHME